MRGWVGGQKRKAGYCTVCARALAICVHDRRVTGAGRGSLPRRSDRPLAVKLPPAPRAACMLVRMCVCVCSCVHAHVCACVRAWLLFTA